MDKYINPLNVHQDKQWNLSYSCTLLFISAPDEGECLTSSLGRFNPRHETVLIV